MYSYWPDNDLGIIKLDQAIGNTSGYLNLEHDITQNPVGDSVQSAGYPAEDIEQDNPTTPGQDQYQWGISGTIDRYIFDNRGFEISTSMNVTAGASGSPVYYAQDDTIYFTGVLSGTMGKANVAADIDQDSYNWTLGVLQQDGYYLEYTLI